jgi:hypothetical protein
VAPILRRAEFYRGHVVRRRGLDVRPGHHPPILDDAAVRVARIGQRERHHAGHRPKPYRVYMLAGLAHCAECGRRLEGQTRVSRGQE